MLVTILLFILVIGCNGRPSSISNFDMDCSNLDRACQSPETARKCGSFNICTHLWEDQQKNLPKSIDSRLEERNNNSSCSACKNGMTFVNSALKYISEEDFKLFILVGCVNSFDDRLQCLQFVKEFGPKWYSFVSVAQPDVFCGQMTVCSSVMPLVKVEGINDITCDVCQSIMTYWKNMISSATAKEEFKTALSNFCADLKEFSDQCKNLVDEHFDQIYDYIVNDLNPNQICTVLGLCNNIQYPAVKMVPARMLPDGLRSAVRTAPAKILTNRELSSGTVEAVPLTSTKSRTPAIKIQPAVVDQESKKTMLEENSVTLDTDFDSSGKRGNSLTCLICKKVLTYLEDELGNNKTEEAIRSALEKACSYLPKTWTDKCSQFVDKYMDLIVDLLTHEVAPEMVCSVIGLCAEPQVSVTSYDYFDGIPDSFKEKQSIDFTCEICKQVMEYLDKELGKNRTEESIRRALDRACDHLPRMWRGKCTHFVNSYADLIVKLLIQEVAPSMICSALGLCSAIPEDYDEYQENNENIAIQDNRESIRLQDNEVNGEIECTVCQYLLHYLQNQLMDNTTEEEIKKELERVCTVLPKEFTDRCNEFLEQYGSSLLALLAQKLDPSIVCVNFKLCPANSIQPLRYFPDRMFDGLKLDKCATCCKVVEHMDKLLENDDVDTELTKLVEKICGAIPTAAREQCVFIIEMYGPHVLQMIGQLANSMEVCKAIDFCPAQEKLLGGEKCTFGPSYWCQSKHHAAACKAELFCAQMMSKK